MNKNLPDDKQNIDEIDTEFYENYLWDMVEEGNIDQEDAEEIIAKGEWVKVKNMINLDYSRSEDD